MGESKALHVAEPEIVGAWFPPTEVLIEERTRKSPVQMTTFELYEGISGFEIIEPHPLMDAGKV